MKLFYQLLCLLVSLSAAAQQPALIPMPNTIEQKEGSFALNQSTMIVAEQPTLQKLSWYLKNELLTFAKLSLTTVNQSEQSAIHLVLSNKSRNKISDDAYTLNVTNNKVTISAATENGLFYGIITFCS
jgi:hexosaminidase